MALDTCYQIFSRQMPYYDAFGRSRVSEPETLFDSKLLTDKLPLFWDESVTDVSGNATSTHSTANATLREQVVALK